MTSLGEGKILANANPLFLFLTNRQMFFLSSLIELAVAVTLLMHKDQLLKISLIAWLSTLFLGYRFSLWVVGYRGSCNCLPNINSVLGLSGNIIDNVMKATLAYLGLVSYGFLILRWFRNRYGTGSS